MAYAIITGASKGLGEAIARKFIQDGINLIAVSRSENQKIKELAITNKLSYRFFSCDLTNQENTESVFNEIAGLLTSEENEQIYLINNAGMVEPIATAGSLDSALVQNCIQVNLTAPILITNIFLKKGSETGVRLKILNITSGAGERPFQGWSIYGSTKAGLNMFTKTVALEAENRKANHQINAFSPGIMDTEMQNTIRSSNKESFNDLEKFREYKAKGLLRSPEQVGTCIVSLLTSDSLSNGKIYHVNDLI